MLRKLNQKEIGIINRALKSFGYKNRGGSFEIRENGKKVYQLSIYKGPAATTGKKLGNILRAALNADAVYDMGMKL